jgi:transposase
MSDFIVGDSRTQATFLPERLEDYIAEENAVRVVDVFIDGLNLSSLGFKVSPALKGRPAYHPATMLKLYIYGYLNRIQSTRRLEREAGRNVELMWLLGRLAPDFKTIADFRKNNTLAIRTACREFVIICRKLSLFNDAFVAVDGSKFKAVNSSDRNFTQAKVKRRLEQIEKSIDQYLAEIVSTDRQESLVAKDKSERLKNKITKRSRKTKSNRGAVERHARQTNITY